MLQRSINVSGRLNPSRTNPGVSVIIPHYDDLDRLRTCLSALEGQSLARDRFEIVVVDNNSPVGLAAIEAAVAGRARVIVASERGAGPARNAGVAASRGALLAFTDCDCVPAPGWLAAGLARLGSADLVGGSMTVSVEDEAQMSGAEAFERVFAFQNRDYIERKRFTVTANLFCSRANFDAIGPFRNGVSEDVDWCHRALSMGLTLAHEPRAIVAHPARRDWDELTRKWGRINHERFGLKRGDRHARLRWAAYSLAMPFSIPAHLPRVIASPALPDAGARLRALGTLARLRLWRMVDGLKLLREVG
jgi:glycosyltransferase involved in cell wall biosynthesis